MQDKRFTNVYFTKRVDHEAGHASDKHMREPSICISCKAIYQKGHWSLKKNLLRGDGFEKAKALETTCPACRQIKTGEPAGFLFIEGDFFDKHRSEIENLMINEGERAMQNNPLARIMKWRSGARKLTVETTTEHLAKHLGRKLKRAFDGEIRYDFSHENKLARIYWHRD